MNTKKEICIDCGRSVARGSGLFVNRVPVLDDFETRKENGCFHPTGEWMCRECDERTSDYDEQLYQYLKDVDCIASGYEWMCEECEALNHMIELPMTPIVVCNNCGTHFSIGGADHAY